MANPNKDQGTRHESGLIKRFKAAGFTARRLALSGRAGEPDIHVAGTSTPPVGVVMWKRLVGKKQSGSRRAPLGEKEVTVIATDDFIRLMYLLKEAGVEVNLLIQAKAAVNISVTKVLKKLNKHLDTYGEEYEKE